MTIAKRAGNLSLKLANAGLGVRPLLFITHSMGGLVVKWFIVDSQTQADLDRKRQVSMVRGIVFCGTPHRGVAIADAARLLGKVIGGIQEHVVEMCANAERLDFLHDQFIEWHRNNKVPIDSYAENVGLFRTRWWWRPLPLGLVVPRASANPGISGFTVRDVDDDHITLVKPRSRHHDVYAGVLRFIETALKQSPKSDQSITNQPVNELPMSQSSPMPKRAPSEIELEVLKIVGLVKDANAHDVAVRIGIGIERAKLYLDELARTHRLIDWFGNMDKDIPTRHLLTHEGRRLLVERGVFR